MRSPTRGEYARRLEDGVALCLMKLADSKTLEEARKTLEQLLWDLHNSKVSELSKEVPHVWWYSKQEADLQEKLVEDAKIGDC